MAYKRKTKDYWEVQGNYGPAHGWEMVTCEDSYSEARQRLREYRENEPQYSFRLRTKRERIEA